MSGQADRSRGRRAWSVALGVLAAVLLLLAVLTLYANRVLFDSDQFANHVGAAVEEPAVKDEIGRRVTDGIVDAQPDLVAVRPVIEGVASGWSPPAPSTTCCAPPSATSTARSSSATRTRSP